jgi:hypothetical protein
MLRIRSFALVLLACGCLPAAAHAAETIDLHASFTPNVLGAPTNASGFATLGSTTGGLPSPVTGFTVLGPAGLAVNLEGTGTCNVERLRTIGPKACPLDSSAGFGGGIAAAQLGSQIIEEEFTLDLFLGSKDPNHLVLLIYAEGVTPVSVQLVFTAPVVKEPKPYGLGFHFNVPIIPTLPGASAASVVKAHLTIGATNVAYFKKVHGKRKLVHVKGLIMPKTCPRGGFPIKSEFFFADGTTTAASLKTPCPKR